MYTITLALLSSAAVVTAFGLALRLLGRTRLTFWHHVLLVPAVLVFWLVVGNALAWLWERRALAELSAPDPPVAVETNDVGREIIRLAAGLGIEVWEPPGEVSPQARARIDEVRHAIGAFVFEQTASTEDRIVEPSPDVADWLSSAAAELDAIENALRAGEPVVFRTAPGEWRVAPLLGLRDLHSALLGSALKQLAEGRSAAAFRRLEGAWRLGASLRQRPETYARFAAISTGRDLAGVLRVAGPADEEWERRLDVIANDPRPLESLRADSRDLIDDVRKMATTARGRYLEMSWSRTLVDGAEPAYGRLFLTLTGGYVDPEGTLDSVEAERARASSAFFRFVQGPLERPYLRLCAADYAGAHSKALAEAERRSVCDGEPSDPTRPRLRFWNLIDDDLTFAYRMSRTVAAFRTDLELTLLVLRARSLREANGGSAWPETLAGLASRSCAGRDWSYTVGSEGTASLRLNPTPFAEREATTTYRLSGAPRPEPPL